MYAHISCSSYDIRNAAFALERTRERSLLCATAILYSIRLPSFEITFTFSFHSNIWGRPSPSDNLLMTILSLRNMTTIIYGMMERFQIIFQVFLINNSQRKTISSSSSSEESSHAEDLPFFSNFSEGNFRHVHVNRYFKRGGTLIFSIFWYSF